MNKYIFITKEGITYQPNSNSIEPDCENHQVIGIAFGENTEEAFKNLINSHLYLKEMNFNEVICYKLDNEFDKKCFYIKDNNYINND